MESVVCGGELLGGVGGLGGGVGCWVGCEGGWGWWGGGGWRVVWRCVGVPQRALGGGAAGLSKAGAHL